MTEVTRIEIELIKELIKEQKEEAKALKLEVEKLREALIEIRVGRKWLIGLLTASTAAGALIDTILRAFRFY